MYSDSRRGVVPWELLSLLISWEREKFKNEVFGAADQSAAGHVF